jgi:hypothetical protein
MSAACQPFGPFTTFELYGLSFLEALEATGDDRRVVSEYVLAILTADEAKPFSIVEPLHCSLFHSVSSGRSNYRRDRVGDRTFSIRPTVLSFGVERIASRPECRTKNRTIPGLTTSLPSQVDHRYGRDKCEHGCIVRSNRVTFGDKWRVSFSFIWRLQVFWESTALSQSSDALTRASASDSTGWHQSRTPERHRF